MPKLKTNKAAAKRYSYTASGKVKRTSANSRHRLATKTKNIWVKRIKSYTKYRRTWF